MALSLRLVISEELDPEAVQFQHGPVYRRILDPGDEPEIFLASPVPIAFDTHADDVHEEGLGGIKVADTDGSVMRFDDQRGEKRVVGCARSHRAPSITFLSPEAISA